MHQSTHTISHNRSLLFVVICISLFFTFAAPLHAQTAGLSLIADPEFPLPHTETTVTIDDYSLDTVGSNITWYVDGVEQPNARNERSLKLISGKLGEKSVVKVALSRANTSVLSTTLTIVPTQIDIILEANTYVPPFYAGRALPTRDSMMRATAVVNDGTGTADNAYVYQWSIGPTVLFGGKTKGKRTVDLEMPHYDDVLLFVEVFSAEGEMLGRSAITLLATEPELHFYEHSPLRGLREREILSPYKLIGEETTIYGEPYFVDSRIKEDDAIFTWKINYENAAHDADVPNALTLRHVGGGGESLVGFSVETKKRMPQFVESALRLIFE